MLNLRQSLLCAVAAMATPMPAFAQDATDDGDTGHGEIIVTAQKRSQSIQQVPIAISALSSELLDERGISTAAGLQFSVPSTQIGNLLGQTSITIRGVGLNQGAPGVAIHVDGVYQPRPSMGDLLQIDLERVEVLRGPQGTLYGRNANGGAVNFITKAPTNEYEGYLLASYANYDDARVQGMVNVPFNDWLKARVVLDWNRRGDGFVKNVIPGGQDLDRGKTFSGRVRFDMELAPNFDLSLSTTFLDGSGPTQYFVLHNQPTALIVSVNPALAAATYSFKPLETSANDPVNTDRRLSMTAATATWSLGDVTLKSISGYTTLRDDSLADDDGINVSIFPVRRFYDSKSFSQELNAALSLDAVDLVTGLYYLKDSYQHILDYDLLEGVAPLSPAGLPPGSDLVFNVRDYDTSVKAAFADVTVRPVANLSLIAGVRYSEERQKQVQENSISIGNFATILTCPLTTNEAKFTSTTPRFGARYEFSSNVNAYATFSKGYKAGGYNLNACDNRFNPEKLTAYEGGLKTRLLDRTLTLNLSAFYYDYTDLQISQVIGLARFINNAAAATIKGAELEADWQPDDHWSINANATYLDARYDSFSNTDGLDPAAGVQVLDGHRLNEAPKFSGNLGVAYRTAASSHGRFTLRTDVSYRSKYYLREFNGPLDTQNAFALINAGLIWDSPEERFRVRLFVNNLTNKAYIARMDSSDNFGARFISWNTPRQYGIELRSNF
ncbi:hypothetical protein CVO77_19305 [Sphingopyxis lindanitolerans]|uniref:TonB-dependent receptor n=1 Tax=Sphingopyxis lindanitolerans TaxID=2054227 RepID=A0A2S8B4A8_9SPHN|nr:TonB-dependent receptor [Sphingopyxis lindanitolerans]PQM27099.1 hypothetical protein CVO77_19305 [Sphingopyxis lindanitolerans]